MSKTIDYFFATVSPWTYLGHDRLVALAKQHGAQIAVKPMNLGDIFPVSGGLPLSKRAPQRQAYRLVELERWSQFLGKPINIAPKFFPVTSPRTGSSPRSKSGRRKRSRYSARWDARCGNSSATSRIRRRWRRLPANAGSIPPRRARE